MAGRAHRVVRRSAPLVAVAAALVLAVVLAGPGARDGPPLDPASTGPSGTRALVDVLTGLGGRVEVTGDVPDEADVVLLLVDDLPESDRARLVDWVAAGGTLVVADPGSPLSPDPVGTTEFGFVEPSLARVCRVDALAEVGRVNAPGAAVLEVSGDAVGCYPRGEGAWLVLRDEGRGSVAAVGGPSALTNRQLGREDNGLLAVALLLPEPGASVAVLRPALPGQGDATLTDLVSANVWLGLAQLAVAFAVVVGWRSRRLGRPLQEPQPVEIAGSELVVAVGNLLQRTRSRGQAARLLRDDLRRSLAQRLGMPSGAPVEQVAQACATRGLDTRLLTAPEPATEEELRDLAAGIEELRASALRSLPTGPVTAAPVKERRR